MLGNRFNTHGRRAIKLATQKLATQLKIESLETRILMHRDGSNGGDVLWPPLPVSNDPPRPEIADELAAGTASGAAVQAGAFTTQANGLPILNSYPNAPTAIYLDFLGGPVWGGPAEGGVNEAASSIDGDPTTFNTAEQSQIYYLWRQVAMIYSMFNVNVTTIDPGPNVPHAWNMVGPNNGGVNSVGSFPDDDAQGISSDWIGFGAGIAHEVGHDFGNWHTSTYDNMANKTEEYRTVTTPLRGPIMGSGADIVNKWTNWHSSLVGDLNQDDMTIISSAIAAQSGGGDGYRPDDYGGTIATATPLTTSGNSQTITGIIERLTDADAFSFNSAGGNYNILVGRDGASGVDVKTSVYDSSGNLLAVDDGDPSAQPYTMVNDSHITMNLPAGKYYLIVQSHGNYDDQGQYNVRVDPNSTGWTSADLDLNALPGYSNYDSSTGTYTLGGSGHDIYGLTDGAQFDYQTLSSNGSITTEITSLADASDWAGAGVMMRSSLSASSQEFSLMATANRGPNAAWRTTAGGTGSSFDLKETTPFTPIWLRITRAGTIFTAFTSTNGISWTTFATQTLSISLGSPVYVGLFATSVDDATTDRVVRNFETATLTNVTVTGTLNAGPTLNTLNAPGVPSITSTGSSTAVLSWTAAGYTPGDANADGTINSSDFAFLASNFGGSGKTWSNGDFNGDGITNALDFNALASDYGQKGITSYSIERSSNGVNFSQVGVTGATLGTFTDSGLGNGLRYSYRLRAMSGTTVSQPGNTINTITRAGPVTNLNVTSFGPNELVVDWTDTSSESSYQIQRSNDGITGWATVGTLGSNFQMFTDTTAGLNPNTKYFYRVLTIDAGGTAATSSTANAFTRLANVTGLTIPTKTSTQMGIQWTAVSAATGYKVERSTDGTTWTVAVANQSALTYTDNSVTPLGEYYYRVTALSATNSSATPTEIFAAAPATTTLPTGWTSTDIGAVGGTGATGYSNGTFTSVASGNDIWNNADAFRFTYVTLPGAGWIQARVASEEAATSAFAKAAVMIRETTAAGSRHAFMEITPSGAYFQYRTSTNGGSNGTNPVSATVPVWLRIERTLTGFFKTTSTIVGKISTDGVTWTTVGTINITNMGGSVLMGLALTAQNNTVLNTSTFDNVSTSLAAGVLT